MRVVRGFAAVALVVAALFAAAEPSYAQSIMQRLFGARSSGASAYGDWRGGAYGYNRYRDGNYLGYGDQSSDGWEEDLSVYSTVCVRLCDGYYFPISFSVRRGTLYRDSRTCMRRCDGEARLFYYPTNGGSVETMVDMAGRPYTALPNAFRYRKALVNGCTCKPAPWSREAEARHQGYAAAEAQRKANGEIAQDDRIDREAYMAQSSTAPSRRGYDDDYDRGDDGYQDPPPRYSNRRPEFYSPWRRHQWDEAPIEAPYDH